MTDAAPPGPVGQSDLAASARKPKILLVDDATAIRLVVSDSLRTRGYDVTEAATEHAAIAAAEAQGSELDFVLVEAGASSKIDGLRLLRLLFEKLPDVPVFLSSRDAKTKQAARELCPRAIIVTTPYRIDDATARLRTLVAPWTRTRASTEDSGNVAGRRAPKWNSSHERPDSDAHPEHGHDDASIRARPVAQNL